MVFVCPSRKYFETVLDEFFKACSGSETKVCHFSFGEVLASPNVETFFISSPSIQLSLGGLLSSRARVCFTGQTEFGFLTTTVNFQNPLVLTLANKPNAV